MSFDELLVLFEVTGERFTRQAELLVGSMGGSLGGSKHRPRSTQNDIVVNDAKDLARLPFGVGHATIEKKE